MIDTTRLMDLIPDRVVIMGHEGECPQGCGEHTEHSFTVDGKPFPWRLANGGVKSIRRLMDDLYVITVELLLFRPEDGYLSFSYRSPHPSSPPCLPLIDGDDFPYLLDASGCELSFGHKQLPSLRLGFFARDVDGNMPVEDQRAGREVICNGGDILAEGDVECFYCHTLVPGRELFSHMEREHSDKASTGPSGEKGYRVC
jgi:hypothetical protein